MDEMKPMAEGQKPEANVQELAAKISQDLLALKEASPEAFQELVAVIAAEAGGQEEAAEGESEGPEMVDAMQGSKGVPMNHMRG
jgi:hypothetical protein